MMKRSIVRRAVDWKFGAMSAATLLALLLVFALACAGSSGGGDDDDDDEPVPVNEPETSEARVPVDFDGAFDDEDIPAGAPTNLTFTIDSVPTEGPFEAMEIDFADTFDSITIADPPAPAQAARAGGPLPAAAPGSTALVIVKVSSTPDDPNVCDDGLPYDSFNVPIDGTAFEGNSEEATPATVNTINSGEASFCITIEPEERVVVTLDRIELDVKQCDIAADDMSGTWIGSFECDGGCEDGSGIDEEEFDIELTVLQDLFNASYTDSLGGTYDGTVCGSVFTYSGGTGCAGLKCEFVETGKLTRTGENEAQKRSKFQFVNDSGSLCTATCKDELTRSTDNI